MLSRDKLIRLNKEIYEDTMKQAALECQPPSCDIEDFSSIEINYLKSQRQDVHGLSIRNTMI